MTCLSSTTRMSTDHMQHASDPSRTPGESHAALLDQFVLAARLAGCDDLMATDVHVDLWMPGHHTRAPLRPDSMAVYVFTFGETCLKVGKVGPNSSARFTSQHYLPGSSRSNLARSLSTVDGWAKVPGAPALRVDTVGQWIKEHTTRSNFILDARIGMPVLNLLEAFLQCRLRPVFEGFQSQRAEPESPLPR